jgi:hypothetical protein
MKTFSTGDTVLFSNSFHMGDEAMFRHLKNIRPRHIHTGLDATEAHHTSIKPLTNQGGPVRDEGKFSLLRRKLVLFDPEFIGTVLQLAFSSSIANGTVQRMVDQQQFQGLVPHSLDALRAGMNRHPIDHRRRT